MEITASIVILTYNNLDFTRQCLESIFALTDEPTYEVILVDNASQDETRDYLKFLEKYHSNVRLILNTENKGFAGGNNQGAAAARGQYLVFLNNDVVVTRGWLTGLLRHLQDPEVGMVGPVTNFSGNESRIAVPYANIDEMHIFAGEYVEARRGQAFEIKMLALFCAAVRRDVFEKLGGLDERYRIGMLEDDDFAHSLYQAGYKILCAEDVFIHHWGNVSFSKLGFAAYWRTFLENRRLFEEKWGLEWHPQRYRDELMDQLLLQLVNNQASLAEYIIDLEAKYSQQTDLIEEFQVRVNDLNEEVARLVQSAAEKDEAIERQQANANLEISALVALLDQAIAEKDNENQQKKELAAQNELVIAGKEAAIFEREQQIQSHKALLREIYSSNAWSLVQLLWRIKVAWRSLRAHPKLAWLYVKLPERGVAAYERRFRSKLPPIVSSLAVDRNTLNLITNAKTPDVRVIVATHQFFDFDGKRVYYGGAERYIVELAHIVHELGYLLEIWQCGNMYWEREYQGIKVTGLNTGGNISLFDDVIRRNNIAGRLIIFSPFSIAHQPVNVPSVGISHGVYWDHVTFQENDAKLSRTIASLVNSMSAVDKMVSVDTNTINWLRTTAHPVADNCTYIPNFVDLDAYRPAKKKAGEKVVVLYPRRLYGPRGFYLVTEILGELLERYPNLEVHLVGQADPTEDNIAREYAAWYPGRVKYYHLPMERMPEVYQLADISIIPTTHSEGTSLSCLEALASGNAVIATNVGGLPDLILSGFNGLLIEPTAQALRDAIIQLLDNPELRQRLGVTGRQVAEAFTLRSWQESWRSVLINYLPQRKQVPAPQPSTSLIFNYAYGVFWDGVKQRPHHLAMEFAKQGIETYWKNPDGRRPDSLPHLHIMDNRDGVYIKQPIFFIYYPFAYEELGELDHPRIVYDVLDDISIHDNPQEKNSGKRAREYHRRLIEQAEFVIASSRMLYNQIKPIRPDVLYVPNGVDLAHFNPDVVRPAPALKRYQRPVIGYHGAIASWFDGQLVADVAKLRPHYDFVLVGPLSDEKVEAALCPQPNIHLLGMVPYEDLPPYVAGFDVCVMPFLINQLTHAVRPLKILEYLSMRKAVVATPIQEIQDWPGIRLAGQAAEFAEAIDRALADGPIGKNSPEVVELLCSSTWEQAARPLLEALGVRAETDPVADQAAPQSTP